MTVSRALADASQPKLCLACLFPNDTAGTTHLMLQKRTLSAESHPGQLGMSVRCRYMYICIYIYTYVYIYIHTKPRRCSVEGPHSQSNFVATLHSIGKINKGTRES